MDKAYFIKIAPAYYELAVVLALQSTQGYIPEFQFRQKYMVTPDDATGPEDRYCLIANKELFRVAIHTGPAGRFIEARRTRNRRSADGWRESTRTARVSSGYGLPSVLCRVPEGQPMTKRLRDGRWF
jgi:hypothetical protein